MSETNHIQRTGTAGFLARMRNIGRKADIHEALPLIPESSIAGKALVTIISIMTFLATLTAGSAVLIRDASQGWSNQITQEMTIQIKPQPGRNLDVDVETAAAAVKAFPGVESVKVFSKLESSNLLEPWLGSSVSLDELPIPRLIVVKPLTGGLEIEKLREMLSEKAPHAVLDDHRLWFERLTNMANALVFAAIFVLALVITAMALAIAFATRGAMAGTRDIIDVLHFVGAHDKFISKEFQKHFFKLGLKGAAIGGFSTLAAFALAGLLLKIWNGGTGSEQIESLFGTFSLSWPGIVLIVILTILIAFLVGNISRVIVFRHLQTLR